mgnify:CR=1 FL=1
MHGEADARESGRLEWTLNDDDDDDDEDDDDDIVSMAMFLG